MSGGSLSRLKVIMVVPAPPQRNGNTAAKWYRTLALTLARRGHRVVYFAPYSTDAEAHCSLAELANSTVDLRLFRSGVPRKAKRIVAGLFAPNRWTQPPALMDALRAEFRAGYDVLHVEHTPAAWAGVRASRAVFSVLQLNSVDLAGARIRSWSALKERVQGARAERRAIRGYRHIRTLSSDLSAAVAKLNPVAHIHEIPIAIDVHGYSYTETEPYRPTYGMIGTMCWRPTRTAALRLIERIAPRVQAAVPSARLLVGGWDAKSWLQGCKNLDGIEIVENIPDAQHFFRQLNCMVYPAECGSGIKVKVLESMAYGVPVVTSPVGLEGLKAKHEEQLLVGQTDEGISALVTRLLREADLRRSLRRAGRALMEERYSPEAVVPQVEAMYGAVMADA